MSIRNSFVLLTAVLLAGLAGMAGFHYSQLTALEGLDPGLMNDFLLSVFVVAVLSIGALLAFGYRIMHPLGRIQKTITRVTEGDYGVRSGLHSKHEIGHLGQAFDNLLDMHVDKQLQIERDNEQLNNSIIDLLQSVYKLSQKDLTINVPVSDNVTGSISDALNLLVQETATVLHDVNGISERVNQATTQVKSQSSAVQSLADMGKNEIYQSLNELTQAAQAMTNIANLAQGVNVESEKAIDMTETALISVNESVDSINKVRDIIHHAEKRLKRLGERSQEISGMVKLVNDIADRTNILALNAGMHAASAGEAGRGFSVIADEIQRLAESSREATAQISELVHNIQIETSDTVNTMNTVISRVVDGTQLAEQAGSRMKETRKTTVALVESVQKITKNSQQQAQVSNALRQRAQKIYESTETTNKKLKEQAVFTDNLAQYARELISAVRVFKLPA